MALWQETEKEYFWANTSIENELDEPYSIFINKTIKKLRIKIKDYTGTGV